MPTPAPHTSSDPPDLSALLAGGPEHSMAWTMLFGRGRDRLGELLAQPGNESDVTLTALEAAWLLEVRRLPHESERLLNRRGLAHAGLRALLAAGAAQMYDDAPAAIHWAGLALAHFGDPLQVLHLRAQCTLGIALLEAGEPRRALPPLTAALRGAARDALVFLELDALRALARAHAELGDAQAADATLAHGLQLAADLALRELPALASLERLRDQRDLQRRLLADSPVEATAGGAGFAERLLAAFQHWAAGEVEPARRLADLLHQENARSFVPLKWQAELGMLRGALAALRGEPLEAPVLSARADGPADLYALQARVLDAGHARLANAPWPQEAVDTLDGELRARGLSRLSARLALVRASDAEALQAWWRHPARDAVDALWLAPSLLPAWPRLVERARDPAERESLQRVWIRLRGLLASEVPATQPPPLDLTPREWAVLRLIGQRWNNAEIADRLHVSEATVKTHINRLYGKLGVRNRAEAIERAAGLSG